MVVSILEGTKQLFFFNQSKALALGETSEVLLPIWYLANSGLERSYLGAVIANLISCHMEDPGHKYISHSSA